MAALVFLLAFLLPSCFVFGERFDGKVALITGGTSGIGLATAKRLFSECCTVVISSPNITKGEAAAQEISSTKPLLCLKSNEAIFLPADVRNLTQMEDLVESIHARYGALHIAVNNAGISGIFADVGYINESLFFGEHDAIMTNLYGVIYSLHAEIAYWEKQQVPGIVVNTASYLGIQGDAGGSMYTASKHGIIGVTQTVALERGKRLGKATHVRCNAVAPGPVNTALLRNAIVRGSNGLQPWQCEINGQVSNGPCADVPEDDPVWIGWSLEYGLTQVPEGRVAEPAEVAGLIAFLSSDDATFITGSVFSVDGGLIAK